MKLKRIFLVGLLAVLLAFAGCKTSTPAESAKPAESASADGKIAGADLDKIEEDNKQKETILLIDVRSPEEYNAGHVKHAINMPLDDLESRLGEIESFKDKAVVTICNTGKKSAKAQELLKNNGFTNVLNADGVKDFTYTTITKAKSVLGPEFDALIKKGDATVLDFRDEKDFNEGHLQGAINTTADDVLNILNQIPQDKPVLTYCYSGNRSFAGAHKLAEKGYDVTNAIDGTKEYDKYELVK